MNIFYMTDSGYTGKDLNSSQQPVYVFGGINTTEEGFGKTQHEYQKILKTYFRGNIPEEFNLHVENLLAPAGKGFFEAWGREKRNKLVFDIIEMCRINNNYAFLYAVDKKQLKEFITGSNLESDRINNPYLLSYEYMLVFINWYIKTGLKGPERGIAILERKEEFENEIRSITRYKKYNSKSQNLIKHLVEIAYVQDSKYNIMLQLSGLICFIVKKHFEIEQGYRENYPEDAKNFFKESYEKINTILIERKSFSDEQKGDLDFLKKADVLNLI